MRHQCSTYLLGGEDSYLFNALFLKAQANLLRRLPFLDTLRGFERSMLWWHFHLCPLQEFSRGEELDARIASAPTNGMIQPCAGRLRFHVSGRRLQGDEDPPSEESVSA